MRVRVDDLLAVTGRPVTISLLTSNCVKLNSLNSQATASITSAAGARLYVLVGFVDGQGITGYGDVASQVTVAGHSLTWTLKASQGVAGGFKSQAAVFESSVSAGATGTLTIDCGANGLWSVSWSVWQNTTPDSSTPSSGAVGLASATADGALSATLTAAPASADQTVCHLHCDGDTSGTVGVTVGAGYTTDGTNGSGTSESYMAAEHRTGSTSTTANWADIKTGTMNTFSSSIGAINIISSSGAAVSDPPYRRRNSGLLIR